MVHERTSITGWHQCLGHPSSKVVTRLVKSFSLPVDRNSSISHACISCSINKFYRLPSHKHGITSTSPFDLIYTNVWVPSPKTRIQGHKSYVNLIDHFTKYSWFFSLINLISKSFSHNFIKWLKLNSTKKIRAYTLIMEENLLPFNRFSHFMASTITPQRHTLHNKMEFSNATIDTL